MTNMEIYPKVGDTSTKHKTSHVKELVTRLNGLQTGQTAMGILNKCVTKPPIPISQNHRGSKTYIRKRECSAAVDTDSITEEPIVPQIIPKQDFENCELESRLPDDSVTEDGVSPDKAIVMNSWTKVVGLETLYTLLSNEHLELQRSHLILQSNLRKEERTRKHLEGKVKYLNNFVLNHRSKQNVLVNPINSSLSQQLDQSKERESKLLEQLQELNDQNELLEFRVLELEQCSGVAGEHNLSKRNSSRTPDTDISDSGVISLSPSEDIYCSDSDFQEFKLESAASGMGGDMKERLSLLCQNLENVSERIVIQQAINLLRHYESRISGMEATVSNMCQELAVTRNMNSLEDSVNGNVSGCRKATRIIATVLPFSGHSSHQDDEAVEGEEIQEEDNLVTVESPFRKLFRENDCMQESGIYFEDEDLGFYCQNNLTDAANQSRLSEELRKLSQIRQKLEEEGKDKYFNPIKKEKKETVMCSREELQYYKEEMERLEIRLQLYESCDEDRTIRLKEILERDEILKRQIRRLEEDHLKLRHTNELLEMEKCEFEELENDTRLQCQRLEVKLNGVLEKKQELQQQIQQNIRLINNLKTNIEENDKRNFEAQERIEALETTLGCYETSLKESEQRTFELEEKELDLNQRIYMLENILPVLVMFHLYRVISSFLPVSTHHFTCDKPSVRCIEAPSGVNPPPCIELLLNKPNVQNKFSEVCPVTFEEKNNNSTKSMEVFDDSREVVDLVGREYDVILESHPITNRVQFQFAPSLDFRRTDIMSSSDRSHSVLSNSSLDIKSIERDVDDECEACSKHQMDKLDLERIIKDVQTKEKFYEQTIQEADVMFSNMEAEYKVQIENLECRINIKECELRQMKNELLREREDNDRISNVNLELTARIKEKESEKRHLNNINQCLKLQLQQEVEESTKFKEEIKNYKKLFENEKLKCKELDTDLKNSNNEIKDIEFKAEVKLKNYEKELERLYKKLEDQIVTSGELKEEVDTLENVVKDLKNALAHERYKRDTLKMEMSEELKIKTKEVVELRRNLQSVGLKSTAQEMEEALALLEQEDESCHLSINEIPDTLEKLSGRLAESQEHAKACEMCKSNFSVVVQDLMEQISSMRTSKLCQGPFKDAHLYKVASLPRIKLKSPSNSNFQLSIKDSLREKCKEKDELIFNLAFELNQLAESNVWHRQSFLIENLKKDLIECPDFTKAFLIQYFSGKIPFEPKFLERSLLDLKIIKAVGSNSLLIGWKATSSETPVIEFQVYINGQYLRKIFSDQGRALLHPINLQSLPKPIEVTVKSSNTNYPPTSAYYF